MKTKPSDTAFATYKERFDFISEKNVITTEDGLSKREYFASMAMQGIASNSILTEAFLQDAKITKEGVSVYARNAVVLADALIAELNKETL